MASFCDDGEERPHGRGRKEGEGRKERIEGGVQEVGCSDKKTSHSQKCRSPSRMNRVPMEQQLAVL